MRRFQRSDRVSEELMKEISSIIHNQMKDPRIASLVSIVRVELSRDIKHAKVFFSVYGSEKEKSDTHAALRHGAGFVRSLLGKNMHMRNIPEINFLLDESMEKSARINELLKETTSGDDTTNNEP